MATQNASRRQRIRKQLKKLGVDGLLVTSFTNVTYLSGFTGDDSYLLMTRDRDVLVSDPRYTTQLEEECAGLELEIRQPGTSMTAGVAKVAGAARVTRLAVEADSMTLALAEAIQVALPKAELVATKGLVEEMREVKDNQEIALIHEAIHQAERAFGVLRATLRPEQTERDVVAQLEHQLRLFGAKGSSFPPIVAVGPRAALPHAQPTDRRIGESDFVLVDWGANGGLYKSDLTRVLVTGKISPKLERVYGVVLKAQLAGIAAIRPGATCHQVDQAARDVIAKAGFGPKFGHGLGHGIGLDIHEGPRLGRNNQQVLKPGMIVTVEPGIYLPGWGGVRIEDDVLVTRSGHEVLTSVAKELSDVVVD
jgi:Xaa-Pro aminopeptidase